MIDGEDNTEQVLATHHIMASTTVPAPGASQKFAETIHDTVVNG